jgi:hypothetical protein
VKEMVRGGASELRLAGLSRYNEGW